MLEEGVYASQSELARGEGVSTAAVTQALRKLRERGG
jgi:Mn-dependent DtxR family transcriptional regulator